MRQAKPAPARKSRRRAWLWTGLVVVLILLLPVGYLLYGRDTPRYEYTAHRTVLVVDGEEVTVTGLLECVRSPLFFLGALSHGRPYQPNGSAAAATRLKGGGAVLVPFSNYCGTNPHRFRRAVELGYFQPIYLIDSATDPQRMEYHYSDVRLHDPNARVYLVDFEIRQSASQIRDYRLVWRFRWQDDLASTIPGLIDDPAYYLGFEMSTLPLSELTDEQRAYIAPRLADDPNLAVFTTEPNLPQVAYDLERRVSTAGVRGKNPGGCRERPNQRAELIVFCEKHLSTSGIPNVNGTPTLKAVGELLPYVELIRRPDALAPGKSIFETPAFPAKLSLFGEPVEVTRGRFSDTAYFAPKHGIMFGLGMHAFTSRQIRGE